MPDLHGWITQQIDRVENDLRAIDKEHDRTWSTRWVASNDTFTIYDGSSSAVAADALPAAAGLIARNDPAGVRRRCVADRKILAAHPYTGSVVSPSYGPHAKFGCETCHDWDGVPEGRGNCDTILALAEGYGLTSEILATLDRPEAPARPERPDIPPPVHLNAIMRLLDAEPASSVPAALRGPNWKAHP